MPKYPYRDLGVPFDRKFRNDLNANFDDIESDIKELGAGAQQALDAAHEAETQAIYAQEQGDYANEKGTYADDQGDYAKTQGNYAKQQGDYAKSQGDYAKSVADQNKTNWLTPVNTFSDISTTYPNPQHGDTVMTTSDGKIYRYVSGSGWKFTQQYNNTVLNDVVNKLAEADRQTQTLEHGLSVLNGNNNAPVDIQIEGRTLVNLLGSDGSFERDSDNNGIADGWVYANHAPTRSTDGKYGIYSQKIEAKSGDSYNTRYISEQNINLKQNSYYLFMVDVKTDGGANTKYRIYSRYSDQSGTLIDKTYTDKPTSWTTIYGKLQINNNIPVNIYLYNYSDVGVNSWVLFDGARIYEIDQATYDKIDVDPEFTGDKLAQKFPYVDSVQHVQNPYVIVEGENLLPPFTDSAWTIHANAVVKSPYELELNATANWQATSYTLPCLPNQNYVLTVDHNGYIDVYFYDANNVYISNSKTSTSNTLSFITPSNCTKMTVRLENNTTGTFTFTNPMLTLGSQPKPFVPRSPSYLFAEVKLGQIGDKKDILFKDNGDWKVTKWIEKDVSIDGKLVWIMQADYTGYKRFNGGGLSNTLSTPNDKFVLTKFNGKELKYRPDTNWQIDEAYCFNNTVSISVSDTDTGWSEHYKPSVQEIQAYFNGWKANGYTTGTAVTNELTGQLAFNGTYTFVNAGAYRNIVVEKSTDGSTWSLAVENTDFSININSSSKAVLTNLNLSPMYFRISYNYGVTVNSWASLVDGSAPATNTLAYVSANLAPNFTPYKLSYVRSTPVTEVVTDKVEGDLVVNGATQVEVGSGVIVREKANPTADKWSPNYYTINTTDSTNYPNYANSFLKNRTDKIINVYKNGVIDSKWKLDTSFGNGKMRAYIAKADYDTTAEYTVTYLLLDRQSFTTNVLNVTATYANNIRSALDDVVAQVSDIATEVSVNINAIVDLYARVKALEGGA